MTQRPAVRREQTAEVRKPISAAGWNMPARHSERTATATSACGALKGNQILKALGPGVESRETRAKVPHVLEGTKPLAPQRVCGNPRVQLVPVVGQASQRGQVHGRKEAL